MPTGQNTSVLGRFPVEESERLSGDFKKRLLRPAPGGDEQGMGQNGVGIGHARLEPMPVRTQGPADSIRPAAAPPNQATALQRLDPFRSSGPQMPPGQDHVGLGAEAAQIGERGQNRLDQLAGQRRGSRRADCCRALRPGREPPGPGNRRCLPHPASGDGSSGNYETRRRGNGRIPENSDSSSRGANMRSSGCWSQNRVQSRKARALSSVV